MRKSKKILAIGLTVIICLTSVFAVHIFATMILDGYSFDLDENRCAVITGWDNSSDTLYVPEYIGDFRTVAIDNSAFNNDDYIHQLEMTDASYLDSIGMYAFANSSLEGKLIIPTHVTYIGTSAFEKCNGLSELSYSSFGGKVSAQCFQYCENLNTVELTDYITSIERYAFRGCTSLSKIIIPRSVQSINQTAFNGDTNLIFYCYTDSYAHQYAEEKGIDYVLIDAPAPTEPPTEEPTIAPTEEPTTAPTETPTLEPTEAPTEAVVPILGDADGNGVIEVDDATYVQRVIAELPVPYPMETLMQGDVDGDGELTITDATLIQRYVAEMPVNYPIGAPITE